MTRLEEELAERKVETIRDRLAAEVGTPPCLLTAPYLPTASYPERIATRYH